MASSLPTSTPAPVKNLLYTLAGILGVDFTLLDSRFRLTLESTQDGSHIFVALMPGLGGPTQVEKMLKTSAFVLPSGGSADADVSSGTATMVASTIAVTVPTPAEGGAAVPVGSVVYATVTTPGGNVKALSAVRTSDTVITISSTGDGYAALLDSAGVAGTLTAGENASITLANAAGDLLSVKETAAGGGAAASFTVVRVNNTTVKVQAHDAAGALVATNTSTVKVYNFGAKAHETSTVRWIVVRP